MAWVRWQLYKTKGWEQTWCLPPPHFLLSGDMGCVHSGSQAPLRLRVRRPGDAWDIVVGVEMPCHTKDAQGACFHLVEYGDGMTEILAAENVRGRMTAAGLDTFPSHVKDHFFPRVGP